MVMVVIKKENMLKSTGLPIVWKFTITLYFNSFLNIKLYFHIILNSVFNIVSELSQRHEDDSYTCWKTYTIHAKSFYFHTFWM